MVTVGGFGIVVGAVYTAVLFAPRAMVPNAELPSGTPFTCQSTDVSAGPTTPPDSLSWVPTCTYALPPGDKKTCAGNNVPVMVAVAFPLFELSALATAVMVTMGGLGTNCGAV